MEISPIVAAINTAGLTVVCLKQYNRASHGQWWACLEDFYSTEFHEGYGTSPAEALEAAFAAEPRAYGALKADPPAPIDLASIIARHTQPFDRRF